MFAILASGRARRMPCTERAVSASPHSATVPATGQVPAAPAASTCSSAEGTALIRLPDQASTVPSASASRSLTTSMLPPDTSGANSSNTDTSKFNEVDASTRESSPEANSREAQDSRFTTLACSTTTPLGRPVEPEV